MNIQQRAEGFAKLGLEISDFLQGKNKNLLLESAIKNSFLENGWFTEDNVRNALSSLSEMLSETKINRFLANYSSLMPAATEESGFIQTPKSIGVIMPSNIPLAGFHDFFCVLISGKIFVGRCSAQDKILIPAIAEMLIKLEPSFKEKISFPPGFQDSNFKPEEPGGKSRFSDLDAVIATGNNNSARYFEYYFGKKPHIIRKNRNSLAVISGKESKEELNQLSGDIFLYFGLGCRNISKIFIPEKYDLGIFFDAIAHWEEVINHHKFANNYNFSKTMFMMDLVKFRDNGFLLLKEDKGLSSPVAVLHYEYYKDFNYLKNKLTEQQNEIQCIVSGINTDSVFQSPGSLNLSGFAPNLNFIPFGKAQQPELWDFADGVDTMKFLFSL